MDSAQLISESYRELNRQLHEENDGYGAGGAIWAHYLANFAREYEVDTLIDYGCGKGSLKKKLESLSDVTVIEYDPAIPDKAILPESAEMVICTDVLEHIEPDKIDTVLEHIVSLATRFVLVSIACRQGNKRLPDGSLCHRIIKPKHWWQDKLREFGMFGAIKPLRTEEYTALLVKR